MRLNSMLLMMLLLLLLLLSNKGELALHLKARRFSLFTRVWLLERGKMEGNRMNP